MNVITGLLQNILLFIITNLLQREH